MLQSKKQLIGTVVLVYDQNGYTVTGEFQPAKYCVDISQVLKAPARTPEQVLANAQAVLADWFLHNETIETSDREHRKIEVTIKSYKTWPYNTPNICELEVWFVTQEQRQFTGVR